MATGKRFVVDYERDEEGWWVASIPSVKGCHTQGRTLAQARARIREALEVCFEDASVVKNAELVDAPHLPAQVSRAVRSALSARAKEEKMRSQAQGALREAVRKLTVAGLSVRDAAELLGISHQRVHQLTHG